MFEDLPDPAERMDAAAEDQIIATLIDRYAAQGSRSEPDFLRDLEAEAVLAGSGALAALRTALAVYDVLRS